MRRPENIAYITAVLGLGALAGICATAGSDAELGAYATSLAGRSEAQRHNARRAAEAIDGATVAPGDVLSFNALAGPWTTDTGYVKAPVSFEGELVDAYGGGVCQTSTTLYNAALLAGLQIVERHRHNWPPGYVAPGRDAAVACGELDLRLRNPTDQTLTIRAACAGDALLVRIVGQHRSECDARIERTVHQVIEPATIVRYSTRLPEGARRTEVGGRPGYSVTTRRVFTRDGELVRRELVSYDRYECVNGLLTVGAASDAVPGAQ